MVNLWDRLKMRLESLSYDNRGAGCAWISVEVLVVDGELRGWRSPRLTAVEPYSQRAQIADIAQAVCEPIPKE